MAATPAGDLFHKDLEHKVPKEVVEQAWADLQAPNLRPRCCVAENFPYVVFPSRGATYPPQLWYFDSE
ncbi:hypothetical protein RRF57_000212 [Xylaria bambusicola]|uniref:Uncharacterized protein n=1 Tax=Xylaria bambusicola TaxID=326684 RepID=A0AAN7YZE6_9PEZI